MPTRRRVCVNSAEARIKAEDKLDGKYVLTTNDDTLSADDVPPGGRAALPFGPYTGG